VRWFLIILSILGSVSSGPAADFLWKAGVAQTKITPEGAYWMGGYASRTKPSEGTDLDLRAKALALQDASGARVVFVTLDLLVVTPEMSRAVLKGARDQYGLTPANVLLNCSHTHCGPELRLYRQSMYDIPEPLNIKMGDYVQWLNKRLIGLIGESLKNLRPASLFASSAQASFAINRRENRGEELVKRAEEGMLKGPVDHQVPVLRVVNAKDKTMAILFGYACHNTIMSFFKTSGDYAGYAQKFIEEKHQGALAMFVMGAGGDQNPHPRRKQEHLALHGRALAEAVGRALKGKQTPVSSRLRAARQDANLKFQPAPDRATLEKQLTENNKYRRWKARLLLGRINAGIQPSGSYDLPVQAMRLGDEILLLAVGGEVVVDYSLRFKKEFGNQKGSKPMLWFAGYSNDVSFYLPSLRVLKEGGYEGGGHMMYTQFTGPFQEDVEERTFAAIRKVVEQVSK
jgi:neutral ceramidase